MASMGDMGARLGMLVVETIAKIRRAYFAQKKPIKAICREFRVSRKVVRKVIRSQATEFRYERGAAMAEAGACPGEGRGAAELCAGRGLPVRLVARGRADQRHDGYGQSRACPTVLQPDAVCARLSA